MAQKTTMVIPSYWTRDESQGPREGDIVYDHPIPINQEGTLKRALESLEVIEDRDFDLVVIAVSNAKDVEQAVEEKVSGIVSSVSTDIPIRVFSHSHLKSIHTILNDNGMQGFTHLLSLNGYSNIRNMCIFLPHILSSDVAVLIDDDEVFEDSAFMRKAREFIGKTVDGQFVGAVAGYYIQGDGDWHIKKEQRPWMKYWNKTEVMNRAFDEIIGKPPRLKQTPFVFGGNMIIHRDIFTSIPFDPSVTRGEDIDYLINMRMFGHRFFLDNTLAIRHLPPPKPHPIWRQIREDIYRFIFERAKLRGQVPVEGMTRVTADELDPYPGAFLKDDLEDKIRGASELLAEHYRSTGSHDDAMEALKNIEIARIEAAGHDDAFKHIVDTKKDWEELMAFVERPPVKDALRDTFF